MKYFHDLNEILFHFRKVFQVNNKHLHRNLNKYVDMKIEFEHNIVCDIGARMNVAVVYGSFLSSCLFKAAFD
jgi:hypothetical protein